MYCSWFTGSLIACSAYVNSYTDVLVSQAPDPIYAQLGPIHLEMISAHGTGAYHL